jgi:hypothetical protein
MDMPVINDQTLFDYTISSEKSDNPSVLVTLEGYATFHDKENRNKRFYKNGFWKKVVDVPRIREMVDTKTLYGSAKHPGKKDNPMPQFDNISHAIRDYKIDDTGVYVVVDVLNTETGRVIKTLSDYGSKIGISTRAYGDQKMNDQGQYEPVEGKYLFVTWDLVVFPAFSDARLKPVADFWGIPVEQLKPQKTYENIMDEINAMEVHDVKMLCDWTGLETEVEKKSELEQALDKIQSLQDEVEGLKKSENFLEKIKPKVKDDKPSVSDSEIQESVRVMELRAELAEVYESLDSMKIRLHEAESKHDMEESEYEEVLNQVSDEKDQKIAELTEQLSSTQEAHESILDEYDEILEDAIADLETAQAVVSVKIKEAMDSSNLSRESEENFLAQIKELEEKYATKCDELEELQTKSEKQEQEYKVLSKTMDAADFEDEVTTVTQTKKKPVILADENNIVAKSSLEITLNKLKSKK